MDAATAASSEGAHLSREAGDLYQLADRRLNAGRFELPPTRLRNKLQTGIAMANGRESGPPKRGRAGFTSATALVALTHEQCWELLRNHNLGRLAIVIQRRPRIFPVNYAAGENSVVFRTEPGAKLRYGPGSKACFEIDDYDERTSMAWSVMVVGALEDITDANDERSLALRSLAIEPAAPGSKSHWLALQAEELSGRSFRGGWTIPGHYLG